MLTFKALQIRAFKFTFCRILHEIRRVIIAYTTTIKCKPNSSAIYQPFIIILLTYNVLFYPCPRLHLQNNTYKSIIH